MFFSCGNCYKLVFSSWKVLKLLLKSDSRITMVIKTAHRTCILYKIKVTLSLEKIFSFVHCLNLIQQKPSDYIFNDTCHLKRKKKENLILIIGCCTTKLKRKKMQTSLKLMETLDPSFCYLY